MVYLTQSHIAITIMREIWPCVPIALFSSILDIVSEKWFSFYAFVFRVGSI